jgi:carbonic anhydrase
MKRHLGYRLTFALLAVSWLAPAAVRAGLMQSPIDIRSEHSIFTTLPALGFSYSSGVTLNVVNTGSPDHEATVRANVPAGAASLDVAGTTYNLLQFHFHLPGEHLLNGHEFDMELHLVHQDPASGGLLVVGRWIEVGSPSALLDPIFSDLPPNPASPRTVSGFDLGGLLPSTLTSFRYPGSLTTFPYDEGVQWVLLSETLSLSAAQIGAFGSLFPQGNSREVQDLAGRVILTDVVGFAIPEPASLALWSLFSGGLGFGAMVRRRSKL